MRKFLILMLVLGMASIACAKLQISAHTIPPGGETWDPMYPEDSDIWLLPSQHVMLDIWTDTTITPGGGLEGAFALACPTSCGTISGGTNVSGEPSLYIYSYASPPVAGIWASLTLGTIPSIPAGSVIVDDILFHCESYDDCLVELLWDPAYPIPGVSTVDDSLIIHQPEPMTIVLLGLGGLLLRRRK